MRMLRRPLFLLACAMVLLGGALSAPCRGRRQSAPVPKPKARPKSASTTSRGQATRPKLQVASQYSRKVIVNPGVSRRPSVAVKLPHPHTSTAGLNDPRRPRASTYSAISNMRTMGRRRTKSSGLRVLAKQNSFPSETTETAAASARTKSGEPPIKIVARGRSLSVGAWDRAFLPFTKNYKDVQAVVLKEGTTLYRCWGGTFCGRQSAEKGRWLTASKFAEAKKAAQTLALPGSPPLHITEYTVNQGIIAYRGTVAPAFGHAGGGTQIFIPFILKNSLKRVETKDFSN